MGQKTLDGKANEILGGTSENMSKEIELDDIKNPLLANKDILNKKT